MRIDFYALVKMKGAWVLVKLDKGTPSSSPFALRESSGFRIRSRGLYPEDSATYLIILGIWTHGNWQTLDAWQTFETEPWILDGLIAGSRSFLEVRQNRSICIMDRP